MQVPGSGFIEFAAGLEILPAAEKTDGLGSLSRGEA